MIWAVVATIIAVLLGITGIAYRRQIKKISEQVRFQTEHDTNLRVNGGLPFSELNNITDSINEIVDRTRAIQEETKKAKKASGRRSPTCLMIYGRRSHHWTAIFSYLPKWRRMKKENIILQSFEAGSRALLPCWKSCSLIRSCKMKVMNSLWKRWILADVLWIRCFRFTMNSGTD